MFSLLRLRAEQREGGGEHKTQFKEIQVAIKTNTFVHFYILELRKAEGGESRKQIYIFKIFTFSNSYKIFCH